jgi:predicted transcriptional regulator
VALTGTLKDFGIAEILQLIGQQSKSGVLHLKARNDEIHVVMWNGSVVSAEYAGRKARDKLGNLLVRADLITAEQLEEALGSQKRTLRRLGDIFVELGMVTKEQLREMTALQTTQTIYKLFDWKSGTYAFEPREVTFDRETVSPLRCESVLMEGYRIIDEWPLVRKKIPSPAMTFERLKELGPPSAQAEGRGSRDGESAALGRNEWRVYELAMPGITVDRIADRSRLGEFEASKALFNLVNLGVLRAVPPAHRSAAAEVGAYARSWRERVRRGAAGVLATVVIAVALAALVLVVTGGGAYGRSALRPVDDNRAERFLSRYQLERLRSALEVYRVENGAYPASLEGLVETGLARPRDLRYPWSQAYAYRRQGEGYLLAPPVE